MSSRTRNEPLILLPNISPSFTFFDGLAFIVCFFAPNDTKLELHFIALEIHSQRHQRNPGIPKFYRQPIDFAPMGKQFSGPLIFQVEPVPMRIGADVNVLEPQFSTRKMCIPVR